MTKTDAHNRDLGGFHQSAEVIDCVLTVSRIARTIGDEDSVEMMSHLVDRIVERKCCHTCTSTNETPQNILFDTAVDNSHMEISNVAADMERRLSAHFTYKVNLLWIDESFILIRIVFLANCYTS